MAMPRLPGESGSCAKMPRPALVRFVGDACTVAPQVSIIARRYGFCSYETLTMYTVTSTPNSAPANASAEPHCPAPVSVVSALPDALEREYVCGPAAVGVCVPPGALPSYC